MRAGAAALAETELSFFYVDVVVNDEQIGGRRFVPPEQLFYRSG